MLAFQDDIAHSLQRRGDTVSPEAQGHDQHRDFWSNDLPGRLDARTPEDVDAGSYDLAVLAMQEPQYANHSIATLLAVLAEAEVPCLSLMNMPPLPFLKRIPAIDIGRVEGAYASPWVWQRFNPDLVSHCSPDPQAMRPPALPVGWVVKSSTPACTITERPTTSLSAPWACSRRYVQTLYRWWSKVYDWTIGWDPAYRRNARRMIAATIKK